MADIPMNERNIVYFPMQSVQIGTDEDENPIYDNAADAQILQNLRQREIKDGVYPEDSIYLQVMSNDNMTVTVKPGYAHVQGVQVWVKEDVTLPVEAAEPLTNRVDRVVLRLSLEDRNVTLAVKKGTTLLTRTAGQIWELGLADLAVAMNNTAILQTEITDLCLDTNACGVVSGLMQVDTETIFNQYMAWWETQQNTSGYLTVDTYATNGQTGRVDNSQKIDGKTLNDLFSMIYPIGSIYMSVSNINPSELFGGTWAAWAAGRVPVGINAADAAFDTVEEMGGSKTHTLLTAEMPNHGFSPVAGTAFLTSGGGQTFQGYLASTGTGSIYSTGTTGTIGSNVPFNIVQPYITCYMWKRTA